MVAGHLFGGFPRGLFTLFKYPSGEPREAENKPVEEKQQQLLIGQRNLSGIIPVSLFLCIIATQVGLQIFDGPKPKDIKFIIIQDKENQKIFTFQNSEFWHMLLFKLLSIDLLFIA